MQTPQPAPQRANGIPISLEDRWLVVGTTGSGKTTFARELVARLARLYPKAPIYVLDSKAVGDFSRWYGQADLRMDVDVPPPIRQGLQIWQPGVDDQGAYDAWFEQLLRVPGPAITLVDEISSIGKGANNDAPPGFQRLLKQGRAKGKLTINCSQEMAYVPRQIKTQTTHVVRFRLVGDYDPVTANRLMGRENRAAEPRHKYGFLYARLDKPGSLAEYASYKDFF